MYGPSGTDIAVFFILFAILCMILGVAGFLGLSYLYNHIDIIIK